MVHAVPFHVSASEVCPPAAVSWLPTATHDRAAAQETAARSLMSTPGAFGVAVSDHVPSVQASARVPENDPDRSGMERRPRGAVPARSHGDLIGAIVDAGTDCDAHRTTRARHGVERSEMQRG
jgi:hypothetical protein